LKKSSRGEDVQSFDSLEEMFDSWEKWKDYPNLTNS
jgi:hypothetical protein